MKRRNFFAAISSCLIAPLFLGRRPIVSNKVFRNTDVKTYGKDFDKCIFDNCTFDGGNKYVIIPTEQTIKNCVLL